MLSIISDLSLCTLLQSIISIKCKQQYWTKKIKASAGIEPATFRLLGERTAIYAKRPYSYMLRREV